MRSYQPSAISFRLLINSFLLSKHCSNLHVNSYPAVTVIFPETINLKNFFDHYSLINFLISTSSTTRFTELVLSK